MDFKEWCETYPEDGRLAKEVSLILKDARFFWANNYESNRNYVESNGWSVIKVDTLDNVWEEYTSTN